MAYSPRMLGNPPPPSQIGEKLAKTWEYLRDESSIGAPFRAIPKLMTTPLPVLLGMPGTEAEQEQAVANAFDAAGLVIGGGSFVPKPANALFSGLSDGLSAIQAKYPSVKLDISNGPSMLTLSRIEVPKAQRGQGIGSSVMGDIVALADANGVPVALSPSGDFGGTVSRLRKFYQRFGFVPNKGRNKDFSVRESYIRPPRTNEGKR